MRAALTGSGREMSPSMNDLRSKVAYLHGLAEGLDIDTNSSEGRVLAAMIDVLGDMAEAVDDVYEAQGELAEYVEEVDDDLSVLEESVFEDEDGEQLLFIPDGAVTDVEDGVEMVCCPECGETISAGAGELEEDEFDVTCPVCGCSMTADAHEH